MPTTCLCVYMYITTCHSYTTCTCVIHLLIRILPCWWYILISLVPRRPCDGRLGTRLVYTIRSFADCTITNDYPSFQESVLTFSYPVLEECDSVLGGHWSFDDEAMSPSRTVMVVPADGLDRAVAELERTINS